MPETRVLLKNAEDPKLRTLEAHGLLFDAARNRLLAALA